MGVNNKINTFFCGFMGTGAVFGCLVASMDEKDRPLLLPPNPYCLRSSYY